jgi:hypothetical protein
MVSLVQAFSLTMRQQPHPFHPEKNSFRRPALLTPPILGSFLDQRPKRIAVPRFVGPCEREFRELLSPRAQIGNIAGLVPRTNSVEPSSFIRKIVHIRCVEHREFLFATQRRKPLGGIETPAPMVLVVKLISITAPPSRLRMDRARNTSEGHRFAPVVLSRRQPLGHDADSNRRVQNYTTLGSNSPNLTPPRIGG